MDYDAFYQSFGAYEGVPTIFRNLYQEARDRFVAAAAVRPLRLSDKCWCDDVGQAFQPYLGALAPIGITPDDWLESFEAPLRYLDRDETEEDVFIAVIRGWLSFRMPDVIAYIQTDPLGSINGFINGIDNYRNAYPYLSRADIDPALLLPIDAADLAGLPG